MNLPILFEQIEAQLLSNNDYNWEVLFVNDGSTDNSLFLLNEFENKNEKVKVVDHIENKGYAQTTQSCMDEASGDYIFIIDSDLQHDLDDIYKFMDLMLEDVDLIIGWKIERKDPFMRVLMSKVYNFIFRKLFKININDVDCGFRAFRSEVKENIKIEYKGVPVGPELIAKADELGYTIKELPVTHYPRVEGSSVFNPFKIPVVVIRTMKSLFSLKRNLSDTK